jgi:hypothetical protein
MANRAIWSMRKRHEWLAKEVKPRRFKRAHRLRCGMAVEGAKSSQG